MKILKKRKKKKEDENDSFSLCFQVVEESFPVLPWPAVGKLIANKKKLLGLFLTQSGAYSQGISWQPCHSRLAVRRHTGLDLQLRSFDGRYHTLFPRPLTIVRAHHDFHVRSDGKLFPPLAGLCASGCLCCRTLCAAVHEKSCIWPRTLPAALFLLLMMLILMLGA